MEEVVAYGLSESGRQYPFRPIEATGRSILSEYISAFEFWIAGGLRLVAEAAELALAPRLRTVNSSPADGMKRVFVWSRLHMVHSAGLFGFIAPFR